MKTVLIVSQKFNLGHVAGLMGWYSMFSKSGFAPRFYLDQNYKGVIDSTIYDTVESIEQFMDFDVVLIFNISLKDSTLVRKLKKEHPRTKVLFLYHEPWRGIKHELERFKRDTKNFAKQVGRVCAARYVVKNADLVICPSEQAREFYIGHEALLNAHYCVFPLVFLDACGGNCSLTKEYFSFIATAAKDKAIDKYFEFVKYAADEEPAMKFQVATSTDVSEYIDSDIQALIDAQRMIIRHKEGMSEAEINMAYDASCCTWLAYRSSTQSGVLPKAFMWGSPCVATPVGIFSELINGENGILVDSCEAFPDILAAYRLIMATPDSFYNAARNTFEKYYAPAERSAEFISILNRYNLV